MCLLPQARAAPGLLGVITLHQPHISIKTKRNIFTLPLPASTLSSKGTGYAQGQLCFSWKLIVTSVLATGQSQTGTDNWHLWAFSCKKAALYPTKPYLRKGLNYLSSSLLGIFPQIKGMDVNAKVVTTYTGARSHKSPWLRFTGAQPVMSSHLEAAQVY